MHRRKTGALLQASVLMGAACGSVGCGAWDALADYGAAIGLAFQVVDDILDVTQASDTLGKTAGKDADTTSPPTSRCWGWTLRGHAAAAARQARRAGAQRPGNRRRRLGRCSPTRWWRA
jgi:farnesyl diphosphate synthase